MIFRTCFISIVILLIYSCVDSVEVDPSLEKSRTRTTSTLIQEVLDSARLNGAILIFDESTSSYYSNDFEWAETGHLPASTFKIPNSIIALESGVVKELTSVLTWDGKKRAFESWERDLTFKDAFQASCVPCYQEIARSIGVERMQQYLKKLEFGEMRLEAATLDQFWLQGESRIDQFQAIDFLERLVDHRLPITARTSSLLSEMMVIEQNESYTLRGKTGWSVTKEVKNGWIVGYLESSKGRFFFATNVSPGSDFDMKEFARIRKEVTMTSLKRLHLF